MTVLDSSAVIDFLLADGVAAEVEELLLAEDSFAAPDLLTFEVLAVLRRDVAQGVIDPQRAGAAVDDLGDLPVELFGGMTLRSRAWELRDNLTMADALFVALAELLAEPLATKDRGLAAAARARTAVEVIELPRSPEPRRHP